LQALQPQFLLDTRGAVAGMGKGVVEDRGLDFGRNAVRVRPLGAGQPIDQAIRPIGLEVPPDFIELLPGIADQLAGVVLPCLRPPRTGRADSYGPRPVPSVAYVR
jgi:hypothetical protein